MDTVSVHVTYVTEKKEALKENTIFFVDKVTGISKVFQQNKGVNLSFHFTPHASPQG